MNNKLLYVYAMTKALYESKGNYIDTFYSFVLRVLPSDRSSLSIDSIQIKIKEAFGLFIPEFSLKAIVTRAKKKDYVTETGGYVSLIEKGSKYLNDLEPESNVTLIEELIS